LKHGLSLPLERDASLRAEIEAQTIELARRLGQPRELVRPLVRQHVELARIMDARDDLIARHKSRLVEGDYAFDDGLRLAVALTQALPELTILDRYDRRARSALIKMVLRLKPVESDPETE
jgi:hypothetical protein